jgi:proline dehydrogenase
MGQQMTGIREKARKRDIPHVLHALARNALARSYFAGPELADALRVCERLSRRGYSATIGYWPNQVDTPREVADAYIAGIDAIADRGLDSTLSVKAMVLEFERGLMTEILDRAADRSVGIHYDSRDIIYTDANFELVDAFARHPAVVGCTLPGAWPRSTRDTDFVCRLGVNVRVVKGMWRDPEHLNMNLRKGYLAVIDRLAGRARYVGVATHDSWLAWEALQRLTASGTACELEQLFGLPTRETVRVAREFGVPVRVYIPYGNSWVPYAFSRAMRRPRMLVWILRDLVLGHWSYLAK